MLLLWMLSSMISSAVVDDDVVVDALRSRAGIGFGLVVGFFGIFGFVCNVVVVFVGVGFG